MEKGSITKVFHTLEKKEMSLSEFEKYSFTHPYHTCIKAIRCIECGDEIIYCKGDVNKSYFRHIPSHEGHGYCSLYHQKGNDSKSYEAKIRKKLFKEECISLNFELKYSNGSWKSLISIPPFSQEDLESNTINNTKIIINDSYNRTTSISIDSNHFQAGELKKIGLNNFPSNIKFKITGNSTNNDICYTMDGFMPRKQLYSSLILQDYLDESKTNINLKSIKMLVCKRISGKVYTGRHYFIFVYGNEGLNISNEIKKFIKIRKIELMNDLKFNYSLYDIVFNNITKETEKFCAERGCELVETDEAVILWPPLNSIGNYKYYKNNKTKMFISFENENNLLELYEHDTSCLFFKVKNINATPFFVMHFDNEIKDKQISKFEYINKPYVKFDEKKRNYIFKNESILEKINCDDISIKGNDSYISLNSSLERIIYQNKIFKNENNIEKLKNAIWYSKEYLHFNNSAFEYFLDKYKGNTFVEEYLNMCKKNKKIKKHAFKILLEE